MRPTEVVTRAVTPVSTNASAGAHFHDHKNMNTYQPSRKSGAIVRKTCGKHPSDQIPDHGKQNYAHTCK